MLRAVVIAVAALLACTGAVLLSRGLHSPGWQLLGLGLVVLLGTVFERWRYGHGDARPNARWESTGERFVDPTTGEPTEVLFDPQTGERRYVTDKTRAQR